jgi:hypothetical protein
MLKVFSKLDTDLGFNTPLDYCGCPKWTIFHITPTCYSSLADLGNYGYSGILFTYMR